MRNPVTIVMLRQPRMNQPTEMRSDPFWEFGSFGLTGCHQRNLLHPKNADKVQGMRFAFAQGGSKGFRLVFVTPPVEVIPYADRSEARWLHDQPFCYDVAPLIVDAAGNSDIPELVELFADVRRNGWQGKFASKFRTRSEPLPDAVAKAVLRVFNARQRMSIRTGNGKATTYEQALPVTPPKVDRNRRQTYQQLQKKASDELLRKWSAGVANRAAGDESDAA